MTINKITTSCENCKYCVNSQCINYEKCNGTPKLNMFEAESEWHEKYMEEAIKEARKGIRKNEGGPFGCVIVKHGKIVGRGHNQVVKKHDPTCHGEMQAIRDACKHLKTFDLTGCSLYTTAAPCPMCRGAIQWANITAVYYGCTIQDTDDIGFRDEVFYNNPIRPIELYRDKCLKLFDEYRKLENKTNY